MIHGMMLVRNESTRRICGEHIYKKVLNRMRKLCDRLVIIDDNSDDDTYDFTLDYMSDTFDDISLSRNIVIKNNEQKWNTNELEVRQQLWNKTIERAKHNDWILCIDADELFVGEHIPYILYLLQSLSHQIDAIGFKLHDMWNLNQYRFDNYWQAHLHMWPLAIRYKTDVEYKWNNKALHCGRFPLNGAKQMLPTQIPLLHYGWADETDRIKKYNNYMKIDPQGKNGVLGQYKSILDTNPNLIEFGRCCIND